ncbi:MAG: DNA primase [Desulfobacter sp.]|nr:DNA primase [Desulfobacter sp.]WDP86127.1 MAG: DNA primase [Desulfobacter sp.]
MLIPEEKISEILNTSDIVDVISEAVILKKSGRNFFGLCPFHSEKTPSFSVNPDKQIFHCFGCSAGGNALSFLMKYHGISFPEAARMLARKYDIVVETKDIDPAKRKQILVKESLFKLNKKVMAGYNEMIQDGPMGGRVRAYLEQRGMTAETIDRFKLGYSPDAWDFLVSLFRKEKVSKNVAVNSGLILPRQQGNGFYDRFRNRLMFPIFDINMQVAGFGGRVMDDAMPKYMNSPETPVYSKSRILYGLHAAKIECRKQGKVFIVEGYFDFLSLYQSGIKNTVASLGTALTREHVRILKGYASQMILVFDSDDAGINAAKRSVKIFVSEGIDTRILVLPGKNDPDSFVMEKGKEAFLSLADKAKTVMQFLLHLSMETHGNSVEGRIKILDEMKPHLALIRDSALRSLYVKQLAETLNIDEKAVLEKVKDAYVRQNSTGVPLIPSKEKKQEPLALASDPREKQILAMMLHHPELISAVVEKKVVQAFYSKQLQNLAQIIIQTPLSSTHFITAVMAKVEKAEDHELIASMAMEDFSGDQDMAETANALMDRIIKIKNKTDNLIISKLLSAEKGCNADVMDLLKQKQREIQQLHNS